MDFVLRTLSITALATLFSLVPASTFAQSAPAITSVFSLVDEHVQENYSFGDDGIDCETETQDLRLIQADPGTFKQASSFLYSYRTAQEVERHGCGIRLQCHAMILRDKATGSLSLHWAHCQN